MKSRSRDRHQLPAGCCRLLSGRAPLGRPTAGGATRAPAKPPRATDVQSACQGQAGAGSAGCGLWRRRRIAASRAMKASRAPAAAGAAAPLPIAAAAGRASRDRTRWQCAAGSAAGAADIVRPLHQHRPARRRDTVGDPVEIGDEVRIVAAPCPHSSAGKADDDRAAGPAAPRAGPHGPRSERGEASADAPQGQRPMADFRGHRPAGTA